MARRPDFIAVGAPKCGTTTLYHHLSVHPDVYMPRKELNHFGKDLSYSLSTPDRAEYEEYFEPAGSLLTGDVSVWYLYSRLAAREIHSYVPAARILIMLRNPVDFMYSMHSEAMFTNDEGEPSFEVALDLETARRRGERLPRNAFARHAVLYRDLARFSEQVARYQSLFPPQQIHVTLLDDLAADPQLTWSRICGFLAIPRVDTTSARENPNKRQRWGIVGESLAIFRRRTVPGLRLERFPGPLKSIGKRAIERVREWNTRYEERPPMDPSLRQRLLEEFEPEIAALERLLDRDLSTWRS